MTRDYAEGYWRAMERAITLGRTLEGDAGFIETEIANDADYQKAEDILFRRDRRREGGA